jgi:hypothetical protein
MCRKSEMIFSCINSSPTRSQQFFKSQADMLTEINVLGVPPEHGVIDLLNATIALDIAKAALDIVSEKGEWLSTIVPRDLAVYLAVQRRPHQMTRVILLSLLSHCNGELEVLHELANMGWLPTYLVPSFNLESAVSDSNLEYVLFIVPKVKPTGSQLTDIMEHIKRTEEKLNNMSSAFETKTLNALELSKKIDTLQKESQSLKQRLTAVEPNPFTSTIQNSTTSVASTTGPQTSGTETRARANGSVAATTTQGGSFQTPSNNGLFNTTSDVMLAWPSWTPTLWGTRTGGGGGGIGTTMTPGGS